MANDETNESNEMMGMRSPMMMGQSMMMPCMVIGTMMMGNQPMMVMTPCTDDESRYDGNGFTDDGNGVTNDGNGVTNDGNGVTNDGNGVTNDGNGVTNDGPMANDETNESNRNDANAGHQVQKCLINKNKIFQSFF